MKIDRDGRGEVVYWMEDETMCEEWSRMNFDNNLKRIK
jgi:hypothetical protein